MQKKIMAVAVAGALGIPAAAFAQASNVQIYGRANLGLDNYEAKGATAGGASDFKNRTRVYDSGSRLGVRGREDLGNGLRAIFQIESGANMDSGSQAGQGGVANGSTGFFASRDSYVGIESAWGRLTAGRQNVFWVNGPNAQTGANYTALDIPWGSGAGMGRVTGPSARTSNVLQYTSPTVSGFNTTISWSPTAGQVLSNNEAVQAGTNTGARLVGATIRWSGPIYVQYDTATARGLPGTGGAAGNAGRLQVTGNKLGISWPYAPGARIAFIITQNKNANTPGTAAGVGTGDYAGFATAGDTVKQRSWLINWEHIFGNIQALAAYSRLNDAQGCTGVGCASTGARSVMLAAKYLLSKRTGAYIAYVKTSNDSNQITDSGAPGTSSVATTGTDLPVASAGADPRYWAVGVMHNF
jgi:predicted porin